MPGSCAALCAARRCASTHIAPPHSRSGQARPGSGRLPSPGPGQGGVGPTPLPCLLGGSVWDRGLPGRQGPQGCTQCLGVALGGSWATSRADICSIGHLSRIPPQSVWAGVIIPQSGRLEPHSLFLMVLEAGSPRSRRQQVWCLARAHLWFAGSPTLGAHEAGRGELSVVATTRALTLLTRAPPSPPHWLPEAHLLTPFFSLWGRGRCRNLGAHPSICSPTVC